MQIQEQQLRSIIKVLQRVAVGKYSQTIAIPDDDSDVHELVVALNIMINDLQEHERAYNALKDSIDNSSNSNVNKLIQMERQFQEAFETAAIGMAIVSLKGEFVRVNQALSEIVGYEMEVLGMKTFQDITHPDDLQKDLDLVQQLIDGKIRTYTMEKRYLHKDKHYVWVNLSASLVRDVDGKPLYFVSQIEDIDERVRFEEKLIDSEEKYRTITENITDMISTHSADGVYEYVTPSSYTLIGYEPKELVGKSAYNFFHPDDTDLIASHHKKNKDGLNPDPIQYRLRKKDGSYVWVETRSHGVLLKNELAKIIAVTRNIESRKESERKIQKAEVLFREIFNNMADGVAIYQAVENGEDFIFVDINASSSEIDSVNREDVVGKKVTEAFPGVKDFGLFDVFVEVYKTGEPMNVPLKQYEDSRIVGWRENYVFKLPSGEIVAVYRDSTEEMLHKQELEDEMTSLEEMNNIMVGREMKMRELKEENSQLKDEVKKLQLQIES